MRMRSASRAPDRVLFIYYNGFLFINHFFFLSLGTPLSVTRILCALSNYFFLDIVKVLFTIFEEPSKETRGESLVYILFCFLMFTHLTVVENESLSKTMPKITHQMCISLNSPQIDQTKSVKYQSMTIHHLDLG